MNEKLITVNTEFSAYVKGVKEYYPDKMNVYNLFEAQYRYQKDVIACVDYLGKTQRKHTYREIYSKVNRLSAYIVSNALPPHSIVAVYGNRTIDSIISLLAILRLGHIYMPMDTSYPVEYIKNMIKDAAPALMIGKCEAYKGNQIEINSLFKDASNMEKNLEAFQRPNEGGFLLYTSGSTGKPKGILHFQEQLINRLVWMWNNYPFYNNDIFGQRCALSTIPSLWDMLGGLLCGKQVVIVPDFILEDPARLINFIDKHNISVMTLTPSILRLFSYQTDAKDKLKSLRFILTLGEPFTKDDYKQISAILENAVIINDYGSTELNTVLVQTFCKNGKNDEYFRPISNIEAFVLDEKGFVTTYDTAGELAISGPCILKEYLNQNELTLKKIKTIHRNGIPKKVFLTGDLAIVSNQGGIQLLGRKDRVLKINGKRIDLDGVNSEIKKISGVLDSLTIPVELNKKILIGAVIIMDSSFEEKNLLTIIKKGLCENLPEFMVPHIVKRVTKMPTLPNGKKDLVKIKKILSEESLVDQPSSNDLIRIFEKIIGFQLKAGDEETEFQYLGMDSRMLMEVISKIRLQWNVNEDISILYNYPTIHKLSKYLSSKVYNTVKISNGTKMAPSDPNYAVIGMSGQFSGSKDIDALWELLMHSESAVYEISPERFDYREIYSSDKKGGSTSYSKWCGTIPNIHQWNPQFFGISKIEADNMDIRQKLLILESYKAMENAGYPEKGGRVGVFIGCGESPKISKDECNSYTVLGSNTALFANRISYLFDYIGPSMVVDTACSSSLSALHIAILSLQNGDCDMALVGGIHILDQKQFFIDTSKLNVFSSQGMTNTFGDNADGFTAGEGVAFLVIKKLDDSVKDLDYIYSVISGTAVNQDGRTNGITAPNGLSQYELLKNLYLKKNIDITTVDYIETHGTGTKIGDVIEINTLNKLFSEKNAVKKECVLGSIKPNIGHLIHAAGIASVVKASLMIDRKVLLPNRVVGELNKQIDWDTLPFRLLDQPEKFTKTKKLRIGVSSFGIGGTNAHCILEGFDYPITENADTEQLWPFLIPKKDTITNKFLTKIYDWINQQQGQIPIYNLSYSLLCRYQKQSKYLIFMASSYEILSENIKHYTEQNKTILRSYPLVDYGFTIILNNKDSTQYKQILDNNNYFHDIYEKSINKIYKERERALHKVPLPSIYGIQEKAAESFRQNNPSEKFLLLVKSFVNGLDNPIDGSRKLVDIGFDSLKIMELQQKILKEYNVTFQLSDLNSYSIQKLSDLIQNSSIGASNDRNVVERYKEGNLNSSSLSVNDMRVLYEYLNREDSEHE